MFKIASDLIKLNIVYFNLNFIQFFTNFIQFSILFLLHTKIEIHTQTYKSIKLRKPP